jgi:hypothetical protein
MKGRQVDGLNHRRPELISKYTEGMELNCHNYRWHLVELIISVIQILDCSELKTKCCEQLGMLLLQWIDCIYSLYLTLNVLSVCPVKQLQ